MSQTKRKIKEEVEDEDEMEETPSKRAKRDEQEAPHPVALVLNRRGMVSHPAKHNCQSFSECTLIIIIALLQLDTVNDKCKRVITSQVVRVSYW